MDNQQLSLKAIPGYPGYEITQSGQVKSLLRDKWLKLKTNVYGYHTVPLRKEGKTRTCFVHRLVALTYIPNPNNYPCVHHLDDCKKNNQVTNLVWCTYSFNNAEDYRLKGEKRATRNQYSGIRARITPEVLRLKAQRLSNVAVGKIVGVSNVTVWWIVKESSKTSCKA